MTDAPVTSPPTKPNGWRMAIAAILDFITAFAGLGFLIAWLTGGLKPRGFALEGIPAVVLILLVIAYFIVFNRYLGGTIWRWILGARRVQQSNGPIVRRRRPP